MTLLHNFKIFLEKKTFSDLICLFTLVLCLRNKGRPLLDSLPLIQRNFKLLALVINNTGYIYPELSFPLHSTYWSKASWAVCSSTCHEYYSASTCSSSIIVYLWLHFQNKFPSLFLIGLFSEHGRILNSFKPSMK